MANQIKWIVFERVQGHCVNIGTFDTKTAANKYRAQTRGKSDRDIFVQKIEILVDKHAN